MRAIWFIALVIAFVGGTGCDNRCDDLQAKLCASKARKDDCKFIKNQKRRDNLSTDTCDSILKSMRSN